MNKTKLMKYKLIIFDCDGVLVDSEPITNRLFTDMVNELGLNLSYKESEKLFTGRSDNDCVKVIELTLGCSVPIGFMDAFNQRVIAALKMELKPVKNIRKVLDTLCQLSTSNNFRQTADPSSVGGNDFFAVEGPCLHRGSRKGTRCSHGRDGTLPSSSVNKPLAICVASNAPKEKVMTSLKTTGLNSYFDGKIFSVQDVKHGKPSPDLYLFAAEKMGVSPNECAVIEDSVFGVRAGIAAGMDVFGYTERIDEELLNNEGAVTFDKMLDLPGLLEV